MKWLIIGKHQNKSAVKKIEKRLGVKERSEGVDFVVGGKAFEFAETESDIKSSIEQLNRSRVAGPKKIIIPQKLSNYTRKSIKGTGIGIENISGTIIKKSRKKSKN